MNATNISAENPPDIMDSTVFTGRIQDIHDGGGYSRTTAAEHFAEGLLILKMRLAREHYRDNAFGRTRVEMLAKGSELIEPMGLTRVSASAWGRILRNEDSALTPAEMRVLFAGMPPFFRAVVVGEGCTVIRSVNRATATTRQLVDDLFLQVQRLSAAVTEFEATGKGEKAVRRALSKIHSSTGAVEHSNTKFEV